MLLLWVVNLQHVEMLIYLLNNVHDSQWWIWFKCFLIILENFVDWWFIWWFTQIFDHPWKVHWLMINLTIHTYVDHPRRIYWLILWWICFIHAFIILEECMSWLYIFWSSYFFLMIHTNYWSSMKNICPLRICLKTQKIEESIFLNNLFGCIFRLMILLPTMTICYHSCRKICANS